MALAIVALRLRNVDGDVDIVGRVGHDKRAAHAQEIVEWAGAFRQEIKRQLNRNFGSVSV